MADISEHFTSPPKAYTEDTLLSAMERAGAEDMPEDAERKGLGTPATRAAILEKLVQMGFVQRKGKQLVPTKDGINLAVVLPESLTSPAPDRRMGKPPDRDCQGQCRRGRVHDRN